MALILVIPLGYIGIQRMAVKAAEQPPDRQTLAIVDATRAFLKSLSADQRQKVQFSVLGPGETGKQIAPEGLKVSSMTDNQRAMLVNVISQWAGVVNDSYAKWSGPITHEPGKNGSSYYRIQGPRLVIEFSPQGVGGDPTMHVHTIYRTQPTTTA